MQVHNAISTCLIAKSKVYSIHMKASTTVPRGPIQTCLYVTLDRRYRQCSLTYAFPVVNIFICTLQRWNENGKKASGSE